jgi:hypothetical protein
MVRAPDDASSRAATYAGLAVPAILTGETGDAVGELVRVASRADEEARARQPPA